MGQRGRGERERRLWEKFNLWFRICCISSLIVLGFTGAAILISHRQGHGWLLAGMEELGDYAGFSVFLGVLATFLLWLRTTRLLEEAGKETAQLIENTERWRAQAEAAYQLREQRHDFRNQIAVLSALLQMGAADRALAYIQKAFPPPGAPAEGQGQVPGGNGGGGGNGPAAAGETQGEEASAAGGAGAGTPSTRGSGVGLSAVFGLLLVKKRRAREEGVRLRLQLDLHGRARAESDPVYVRMLSHLIDNAFEAARMAPGGEPEVSLRLAWEPAREVLEVWNNGPPVPAEELDLIFQPGFSTKGSDHWGLGLSEVYQWVTGKNGELLVESAPGKGTRFYASYPSGTGREGGFPSAHREKGG